MLTIDLTEDAIEVSENFALDPLVLLIMGAPHGQQDRCMWHATLWDHVLVEPEVTSSMGATLGRPAFRVNERSLANAGGTYEIECWTRLGKARKFSLNLALEQASEQALSKVVLTVQASGTKSTWLFDDRDPMVLAEGTFPFGPRITLTTSSEVAVNERLQLVEVGQKARPTAWERLESEDE